MSRDPLLYVADIVAAGKAIRPGVPWRKIIGLRNLLAHGHWVIEAEELRDVASAKVPDLLAELRPLLPPADEHHAVRE